MKLLTAASALLSLGIFSVTAHGATTQANPSGPYVGVGWGQFNLDIGNLNDVGVATGNIIEGDDNAFKVFAGWRFNPYLSLEAAYIDFGSSEGQFDGSGTHGNYQVDISGFAPYLIGTLPLGSGAFELFAKVGMYYYDANLSVELDSPGPDIDSSHSRNDVIYGAGFGVTLADHFNLRAEYELVEIENADSSEAIWLSAAWRF
jgi:OOP family OmpA-OmpF porin